MGLIRFSSVGRHDEEAHSARKVREVVKICIAVRYEKR